MGIDRAEQVRAEPKRPSLVAIEAAHPDDDECGCERLDNGECGCLHDRIAREAGGAS